MLRFILALSLLLSAVARAQPAPPAPRQYVTHHRLRIGGQELAYAAVAADTHLTNAAGEWIGDIFSFSYLLDDSTRRNRPVLFIFNGGPGSSSIWLHLGVMGPRRVVLSADVNPRGVPPFGLADNPYCPLDVADLVFIDPVGTGFSHIAGAGKPTDFFGVDADADITAQFIERWLSRHQRWNSPKFVMGESYGSTRAALLPNALLGGPSYLGVMRGITLNGIILLGTTLTLPGPGTAAAQARRDALALPAMAATAWYYRPQAYGGQSLAALHAEATRFAEHDYLPALLKAGRGSLPPTERQRVLARLRYYTGLPAKAFSPRLQLDRQAFARQVLAARQLHVGLYDSRYTLPAHNAGPDPVADDPAMGQYMPGFVAAFHDYLHRDLGVGLEQPYGAIVWRGVGNSWNWAHAQDGSNHNVATDLAAALRRNRQLRVLVAAGYYDLVTTAAAARDELTRAAPPADQVTYRTYASGHMLYLGDTAADFARDVRALIQGSEQP
jgi:carboxypeptidase C (cathepsin A)